MFTPHRWIVSALLVVGLLGIRPLRPPTSPLSRRQPYFYESRRQGFAISWPRHRCLQFEYAQQRGHLRGIARPTDVHVQRALQTPTDAGAVLRDGFGAGAYRETLNDTETNVGVNVGGGVKIC
jgi:hypothetical protein